MDTNCPVCTSTDVRSYWRPDQAFADSVDRVEFFRSPFKPGDELLQCQACRHIFLFPQRTTNEDISYNTGNDQGLFKYTLFRRHGYTKNEKVLL